jgi:hypothetical protein
MTPTMVAGMPLTRSVAPRTFVASPYRFLQT